MLQAPTLIRYLHGIGAASHLLLPPYTFASSSFLLLKSIARLPFASSTQKLDRLKAFRRRRLRHDSPGHSEESLPDRERGRSPNSWLRKMQNSKDEAKRSRSPEMRADSSTEVRERTPLRRSQASHSDGSEEDSEPSTSSTKVQDFPSSPASEIQEPSMPYFLQLTDLGLSSQLLLSRAFH